MMKEAGARSSKVLILEKRWQSVKRRVKKKRRKKRK